MGLQKYRADTSETQPDGSVIWRSKWMGGPSLAKIDNCRLVGLAGDMRTTVYITGDEDTWFSIPAKCRLFGKTINGYVTRDDARDDAAIGELVFHHCYY